jgi:hypothetical protein
VTHAAQVVKLQAIGHCPNEVQISPPVCLDGLPVFLATDVELAVAATIDEPGPEPAAGLSLRLLDELAEPGHRLGAGWRH